VADTNPPPWRLHVFRGFPLDDRSDREQASNSDCAACAGVEPVNFIQLALSLSDIAVLEEKIKVLGE
jgi:hypothetical protein